MAAMCAAARTRAMPRHGVYGRVLRVARVLLRGQAVKRAMKRLAQTFEMTKFAGVPMVPVAARPGAQEGASALGTDALKVCALSQVERYTRGLCVRAVCDPARLCKL